MCAAVRETSVSRHHEAQLSLPKTPRTSRQYMVGAHYTERCELSGNRCGIFPVGGIRLNTMPDNQRINGPDAFLM